MEQYRKKNRKILREKERTKRKNSPETRLVQVLRTTLNRRIKLKNRGGLSVYVEYTPGELRRHIENQFVEGMSWKNYGRMGWHVDHRKPLASFTFFDKNGKEKKDEISRAMALNNLQPLWAVDNLKKGCK